MDTLNVCVQFSTQLRCASYKRNNKIVRTHLVWTRVFLTVINSIGLSHSTDDMILSPRISTLSDERGKQVHDFIAPFGLGIGGTVSPSVSSSPLRPAPPRRRRHHEAHCHALRLVSLDKRSGRARWLRRGVRDSPRTTQSRTRRGAQAQLSTAYCACALRCLFFHSRSF